MILFIYDYIVVIFKKIYKVFLIVHHILDLQLHLMFCIIKPDIQYGYGFLSYLGHDILLQFYFLHTNTFVSTKKWIFFILALFLTYLSKHQSICIYFCSLRIS